MAGTALNIQKHRCAILASHRRVRAAATDPSRAYSFENLDGVPAPVARYLRLALPHGVRTPDTITLSQTGELRTDEQGGRWMPFEAAHTAAPLGTAFLWNAKVRVAPLVHVRVIDSLVQGIGAGAVLFMSAFRLDQEMATPEMNSGSLHRFLAEAVWYPWALLPRWQLQWEAVDDARAIATLSAGSTTVSLEFRFASSGEVVSIYTPGRWGRFGKRYEQVPWEGHFRDYTAFNGVRMPRYAEVGWYRKGKLELVWKGRIRAVH